MLKIEIKGTEEVNKRFKSIPSNVKNELLKKVFYLTIMLESYVKNNKLSGQVLHTISGRLKRSIQYSVKSENDFIKGSVFSSGDVPYAGIHEFGGKTPPHIIVPVKAKALAFAINGKTQFAKIVNHPGSRMPVRSYLRSSLDDKKSQIIAELTDSVEKAISQ